MGTKMDLASDLREGKDFPSKFVSAGSSADYHGFQWRHDGNGRIEQVDSLGVIRRLAAHRTWKNDCYAGKSTKAITTTFKGHENFWKM
jgi:hypothetical protein